MKRILISLLIIISFFSAKAQVTMQYTAPNPGVSSKDTVGYFYSGKAGGKSYFGNLEFLRYNFLQKLDSSRYATPYALGGKLDTVFHANTFFNNYIIAQNANKQLTLVPFKFSSGQFNFYATTNFSNPVYFVTDMFQTGPSYGTSVFGVYGLNSSNKIVLDTLPTVSSITVKNAGHSSTLSRYGVSFTDYTGSGNSTQITSLFYQAGNTGTGIYTQHTATGFSIHNGHFGQIGVGSTLTADRTYSLPDASGTFAFRSDLSPYQPRTLGTITPVNSAIASGDSITAAFGKTQGQINALGSGAYTTKSVYNAADYGAVDDSLTNCAAPIQRAIDTAHAHGGGIVMLPIAHKGKILVGSTIYIPGGVTVQGQSSRNPIVFNNGNFTIFSVTGQGASLVGMIVDAYGFFGGVPGRTGHALDLIGATSINVSWFDAQNVEMLSSSSCVYINGTAATSQPSHSVFYNCIFFNTSATSDTTITVKNLRYAQFYGCSMFATASSTAPSRGYWDANSQYGEWNGGVVGGFSIRGQDFRAINVGAAGNVDFYGLRPNYVGSTINGNLTIHPTDTSAYISTTVLGSYIDSGVTTRVILTSQSSAGGDLSGKFSNITVSGIKGSVLPSLSSGLLRWNGSAWVFDNTSFAPESGLGIYQPRIIGNKPVATSTTYAQTDSVTQILANLNSGIIANTSSITTLQNRNINTGTGLTGGGNLTADRTLKADTSVLQTVANFFPKGDTRYAKSSTAVTGGVINWPGTLYTTPTTATYSSGTLTFAPGLATQSANLVLAGPSSGVAATPTFRTLVSADIPSLSGTYVDLTTAQSVAGKKTFTNVITQFGANSTAGTGTIATNGVGSSFEIATFNGTSFSPMRLRANSSDQIVLNTDGSTGFGSSGQFKISATGAVTTSAGHTQTGSGANTFTGATSFGTTTTTASWFQSVNGAVTAFFYGDGTNNQGTIGTISNHPLSFVTNNLNRLWIANSGNVSIGSTTTTSLFNVGSSAQFQVSSTGAISTSAGATVAYLAPTATQTTVSGATAGSIVANMPMQGTTYKKVVVYINGLTGAATYTFPTAFTNGGQVTSTAISGSFTYSQNSTSITITGTSACTGWLVLEGY